MAIGIIVFAVIIVLCVNHSSAKKDEKETSQYIESMDRKPEHAWVSGEASPGAWVFGVIVIIAAVLIASHL